MGQTLARGHGWVRPNPDGSKVACGGPSICAGCQQEADRTHPVRASAGGAILLPDAAPVLPPQLKMALQLEEAAHMVNGLRGQVHQLQGALRITWEEAARYREALTLIAEHGGKHCGKWPECKSEICESSVKPWEMARQVLHEHEPVTTEESS